MATERAAKVIATVEDEEEAGAAEGVGFEVSVGHLPFTKEALVAR